MGCGKARGKPAYGTAVGIFTSPDGVGEGSGEASLWQCGRNLYLSGWGVGRPGGSLRHCGRNLSISGWGGGGSGEASLRHCGRNLYLSGWGAGRLGGSQPRDCGRNFYVSGWGGGGLEGKAAYGTAVGFFFTSQGKKKGCRHRRRTLTVEKHRISTLIVHLHITSLIRYLGQISSEVV